MDYEKFGVSTFDLKGDQYIIAFSALMGMLKANFEKGKDNFTKEELIKLVQNSVDFAKEEREIQ